MSHRIMKIALINNEIDNTMSAIRYVLKYASLMNDTKKSEYGRLLVKLEKQAERLPKRSEAETEVPAVRRKIEVTHVQDA